MRIVAISDTHNRAERLAIPEGDLLVHAGDFTMRGSVAELERAARWLGSLRDRFRAIVAVPGNHDFGFQRAPDAVRARRAFEERGISLLIDDACTVDGVRFFGSPWQPWFYDWAFNFPRADGGDAAQRTWAKVPGDTNVLVTHGPPRGILDEVFGGRGAGCPHLRARIDDLRDLRAHVFGHIHEAYGSKRRGEVLFVNAATCDRERYAPIQPPIVFEIAAS